MTTFCSLFPYKALLKCLSISLVVSQLQQMASWWQLAVISPQSLVCRALLRLGGDSPAFLHLRQPVSIDKGFGMEWGLLQTLTCKQAYVAVDRERYRVFVCLCARGFPRDSVYNPCVGWK